MNVFAFPFLRSKKRFDVTVPFTSDTGHSFERTYRVYARDEDHAKERAKIIARLELNDGASIEDKTMGLVHRTKWYEVWRLRNYERGVRHAFDNAGFRSGALLGSGIKRLRDNIELSRTTDETDYNIDQLRRQRNVCIFSAVVYWALFMLGGLLIVHGLYSSAGEHHLLPSFLDQFVFGGFVAAMVGLLLFLKAVVHFNIIRTSIAQKRGE